MKKKNRNLKAVMAVIVIFLVVSLVAGAVMALKDTSVMVENSSSIQTESGNRSDGVLSDESSVVSQQETSSSDDSTSSQGESTEQSDDISSADSESSQSSSEIKPTQTPTPTPVPTVTQTPQTTPVTSQMKAMWISYLEFQSVNFSSKTAFVSDMTQMFQNCKSMGLDTVIVQVRPFGDALYKSSVFPSSHLITGVQGAPMAYDPLEEMVKIAHGINLRIEAWVNPYRVRLSSKMPDNIAQSNPANNKDLVIEANGGVYYNPALSEVQDLVAKGVAEIVENYDVDGIHLDDYFYPSTEASLDEAQYKASGTSLSQDDWRRENVNTLVRKLYSTVKGIDSSVTFGISPQGNNDNNYTMQYSDVKLWLANEGYADYIMPQLYWGFGYLTKSGRTDYQFINLCEQWESYPRAAGVKLYIGLGAYRIGDGDGGANDQSEWSRGDNLMRMISTINSTDGIDGFVLYRYDNLFKNSKYAALAQSEVDHITEIMVG
ncbi:MAG: family 10 glycosylhydrolase [Oscillospiraceae bacterium]|nr:family 10 glycosylhydrolase [Oscillospiraceae bacterium]